VQQWEYLWVDLRGDGDQGLSEQDMLVTTTDGRFQGTKMPTDPIRIINELGAEGWEMVGFLGSPQGMGITAVFKRPKPWSTASPSTRPQ
jgi:hypothetical protein